MCCWSSATEKDAADVGGVFVCEVLTCLLGAIGFTTSFSTRAGGRGGGGGGGGGEGRGGGGGGIIRSVSLISTLCSFSFSGFLDTAKVKEISLKNIN